MADSWIRNLEASDRFLGQIRRLNSFATSEKKNVEHLSNLVKNMPAPKMEESPNMLAAVNACVYYSQESKDVLLQSIVEKANCGSAANPSKEAKQQDYTNLCKFLPPKVYNPLMNLNTPTCDALCLICQWSAVLGLKRPTEGTLGTLTCIANWKSWSSNNISTAGMHSVLQSSKKLIKEHLNHFNQKLSTPVSLLLNRLPERFEDLPVELQHHFGGELLGYVFYLSVFYHMQDLMLRLRIVFNFGYLFSVVGLAHAGFLFLHFNRWICNPGLCRFAKQI